MEDIHTEVRVWRPQDLLVHKLQIQADKIISCINDKAGTQVAPCEKLTAAASKSQHMDY